MPDGIAIRIPAKRNALIIAFLALWLCGWLAGEIAVFASFFKSDEAEPGATAFALIWLAFWTLGGALAIYIWLWQIKGCEVITVSPAAFGIRREVFGIGTTKQYDVAQVRNIRVSSHTFNPFDFRDAAAFWGLGGGSIAFDYGFKTYRFAAGIDEAEARVILQAILSRVPRLEANVA